MNAQIESETLRQVAQRIRGLETSDGAGVRLTRVIGSPRLDMLDPFLLLDHFRSDDPDDYIAGFPEHPHRGFETVTYLLAGHMRHGDNAGHSGVIRAGGAQWMTAGRGILHSEMPEQEEGLLSGFQLWVNLPAEHKMTAPRYQELEPAQIPLERHDGVEIRVLAGTTAAGTRGPVADLYTEVGYLDIRLAAGARHREPVPAGHNAFLHVFAGDVRVGDEEVAVDELAVLGPGEAVELLAGGEGARLLLVHGRPLAEPVARRGPFVMNTQAELIQAFRDYQEGRL